MENNPFYVLSTIYKNKQKNKQKEEKQKQNVNINVCVNCNFYSKDIFFGDYEGWCKSCKEIDEYIYDWNWACLSESGKPKNEQREEVFRGIFIRN